RRGRPRRARLPREAPLGRPRAAPRRPDRPPRPPPGLRPRGPALVRGHHRRDPRPPALKVRPRPSGAFFPLQGAIPSRMKRRTAPFLYARAERADLGPVGATFDRETIKNEGQ